MKMFAKNLKKLDFYAYNPKILYNRRNHFPSWIGLCSSCTLAALMILFLCFYISPVLSRTEPQLVLWKESYESAPATEFDTKIFNMGFALTNRALSYRLEALDPSIFSMSFDFFTFLTKMDSSQEPVMNISAEPVRAASCSAEDIPIAANKTKVAKNLKLNRLICMKKGQNFKLQGQIGDPTYSFIRIAVSLCNNRTSNNTCAPKEKIISILPVYEFVLGMLSRAPNLVDFENPLQLALFRKSFSLDVNMKKIVTVNMKKNYLRTESSSFFRGSLKQEEFVDISDVTTDYMINPFPGEGPMIEFIFQMEKNVEIVYRSYDTIPEVLAKIGGLFKLLSPFFLFTVFPITELLYKEDLLNRIHEGARRNGINYIDLPKKQNNHLKSSTIGSKNEHHAILNVSFWEGFLYTISFGNHKTKEITRVLERFSNIIDAFDILTLYHAHLASNLSHQRLKFKDTMDFAQELKHPFKIESPKDTSFNKEKNSMDKININSEELDFQLTLPYVFRSTANNKT